MTQQPRKPKRVRKNAVLRGGVWYYRKMVDGKPVRVSTGQSDYKLAEVKLAEIEAAINRGEVDKFIGKKEKVPVPTFTVAATELAEIREPKQRGFGTELKPAVTFFGEKLLDAITTSDCERFLRELRASGWKANTLVRRVAVAEQVFNRYIRLKVITINPFDEVDRSLLPRTTYRDRVVSLGEQAAVLDAASPVMRRILLVLFGTGIRKNECMRLEPRHIDLANNLLVLSDDVTKGAKARTIPMQPAVAEALIEQMKVRETPIITGGRTPSKEGTARLFPYGGRSLLNTWLKEARLAARVKHFTVHDCRRTFGTRCAEQNVPMHVLQKWMGHSDIKITSKFYLRSSDETGAAIARGLNLGLPAPKVVSMKKMKGEREG